MPLLLVFIFCRSPGLVDVHLLFVVFIGNKQVIIMLLALLLFFTPAISANVEDHWRDELAALHRKLDQLREDLVTLTPADDSTPEDARRSLQSIDTSKHIGLEIRQDKVCFGVKRQHEQHACEKRNALFRVAKAHACRAYAILFYFSVVLP